MAAAEAALDALDGARRAELLEHVEGCVACRAELRALVAVADTVLALAPAAEPPPGFESRVLDRIAADRPAARRSRRWWLAPVAAAAAGVAVLAGVALGHDGHRADGVAAARLLGADGTAVGQVLVSDEPDRMVCVLDGAPAGARYAVSITARGRVTDLGTFTAAGPGRPWGAELPVEGSAVRRIVIRDPDGRVRATADLGGQ
jgi:hypothetical protein